MKLIELGDADGLLIREGGAFLLLTRDELVKTAKRPKAAKPAVELPPKPTDKKKRGLPAGAARLAALMRHTDAAIKRGTWPSDQERRLLSAFEGCTKDYQERYAAPLRQLAEKHDMKNLLQKVSP